MWSKGKREVKDIRDKELISKQKDVKSDMSFIKGCRDQLTARKIMQLRSENIKNSLGL